jgi:hypothetical protein
MVTAMLWRGSWSHCYRLTPLQRQKQLCQKNLGDAVATREPVWSKFLIERLCGRLVRAA